MSAGPDVPAPAEAQPNLPWYRGLTAHHWFVLIVCWLGWLFDTMDQQLFILSRKPAMEHLVGRAGGDPVYYGSLATMFLVLGWATGGIIFGILGDRWGRAKTLVLAVLSYSIFTGLSAVSMTWLDFSLYRFLTGMGVGGAFAAAVSMVAETLPSRSRPYALGFLQVLAATGNVTAACISLVVKPSAPIFGLPGWRALFLIGIIPALAVLIVMRRLKEPESWLKAKEARARGEVQGDQKMGSLNELFGDPRWRKNLLVGLVLGLAGVIGLWGIGFYLPELVREVVKDRSKADWYVSMAQLLFNGAAAVGTYLFAVVVGRVGRRPAFAMIFALALVSVFVVFGFMSRPAHIWWMAPLLGLGTLTVFGGYSIYFPELFPTRLRATGVGFCYNTARYIAAPGSFALGWLTRQLMADPNTPRGAQKLADFTFLSSMGGVDSPFRYAAIFVSVVFVFGLLILFFAPETRGKPLPE